MARYEITGPDGAKYEVNAPDNVGEKEVMDYAQKQFAGGGFSPRSAESFAKGRSEAQSMADAIPNMAHGAVKGFADLAQGGFAQPVMNAAASVLGNESLSGKPGPASQWVIDKSKQYNKFLQDQEKQYQADTEGSMAAGVGRVGAGALPFMLSGGQSASPQVAASMLRQMGQNAGKGAAFSVAQPVTNGGDNYLADKAKQAAIGAVSSAAVTPLAAGLSRVINPQTDAQVKSLMNEGVNPTPGQILGGAWKSAEEKLTSVPLIGDMIKNAQRRSLEDFNRAAYKRALDPIGEQSAAPVGRAGVEEVKTKLGQAYDDLLPKLQFKADQQFSSEVGNLTNMIRNGNVPPDVAKQFENIVKNEVFSRMTKQGAMDGKSFKELESSLGQQIKRFGSSQDPSDKAIGDALKEVLSSARGVLTRANPDYATQLQKINEGYANYARVRGAASALGADEGVFTAAQLQNAVKSGDKSAGKGNFATGNALMQDLSESGKKVLGNKYPDSGTVGRATLLTAAPGVATSAYHFPIATAAMAGGAGLAAMPYTSFGQKMAAALLSKRPEIAGPAADLFRSGAPAIAPALTPGLIEALKAYTN
jgi:hypothetical protein